MADNFYSLYEMVEPPSTIDVHGQRRYDVPDITTSSTDDFTATFNGVKVSARRELFGKDDNYKVIYPHTFREEEIPVQQNSSQQPASNDIPNDVPNDTPDIKVFKNRRDFVQVMLSAYQQELEKKGLDPGYAKALVAQDALETGWGSIVKGDYNFGNITTNGNDWHKKTGKLKWKDFSSLHSYVSYKIDFLSNKRYRYFQTFSANSNVATAMQVLANRGYCPGSPSYGRSVQEVYNSLSKYLT